MEAEFHRDVPGTGPPAARHHDPGLRVVPFLDDARPFSRADLESDGSGPIAGRFRAHGAAAPRSVDLPVHGSGGCGWHVEPREAAGRNRRKSAVRTRGSCIPLWGSVPKIFWGTPKCGASWEGVCDQEVLAARSDREEAYFGPPSRGGAGSVPPEKRKRLGFEIKRTDAPSVSAVDADRHQGPASIERLVVLYPGATRFPLADKVEAMPLRAIAEGFGSRMT